MTLAPVLFGDGMNPPQPGWMVQAYVVVVGQLYCRYKGVAQHPTGLQVLTPDTYDTAQEAVEAAALAIRDMTVKYTIPEEAQQ